MTEEHAIEAEILRLAGERGADKSICPSKVARTLVDGSDGDTIRGDWRPLMPRVRQVAVRISESGRIDILRKGRPVAAADVRGVIRLRIRRGSSAT